jgi:signal transduction histidine kinase
MDPSERQEPGLKEFLENLPNACLLFDRELRYVYFNDAAERFTGVSLDKAKGKRITDIVEGVEHTERYRSYRGVLESGQPSTLDDVAPGGLFGDRHFKVQCFKVGDNIGVIFTDISKEKIAEKALSTSREEIRNLASHIEAARENERKRIAREIHDELGQILTAIDLDIHRAERRHDLMRGEADAWFGSLSAAISKALDSVHRIAMELRPGILDNLGLSDALEWLVEDSIARSGIRAECRIGPFDDRLPDDIKTALFRIAQEACTNAVRYSQAKKILLSLQETEGALCLRVEDDGVGMMAEAAASPCSFGFLGMRERALDLGGMFTIDSSPGKGLRIEAKIPRGRPG